MESKGKLAFKILPHPSLSLLKGVLVAPSGNALHSFVTAAASAAFFFLIYESNKGGMKEGGFHI